MTSVLVFGGGSMVGAHFAATSSHQLSAAGRSDPRRAGLPFEEFEPVDLNDPERVESVVRQSKAEVVVNFAALTDVDGVERERPLSLPSAPGAALRVNAGAPAAMARSARVGNKFLISLSTDFVFDGARGPYSEEEDPSPFSARVSWYGWTKGEGERQIHESGARAAVVRIAYPYRTSHMAKLDFARRMVDGYRNHRSPPFFSDQIITPTWIPDVSASLDRLIRTQSEGIFHIASPETTTPYRFALELLGGLGAEPGEVAEGSMERYSRRPAVAPRPLQGGLSCRRAQSEGLSLTTWKEGIRRFLSEGGAA